MQPPPEVPPATPYAAPWPSAPPPLPSAEAAWSSLRTLSTMAFLFAALCALAWASTALLLAVGIHLESTGQASDTDPVPAFVFLGIILLFLTPLVGLLLWTGASLRQARRRELCMLTAGLACIAVPLGTALGLALLLVLQRPDVRALFDASEA